MALKPWDPLEFLQHIGMSLLFDIVNGLTPTPWQPLRAIVGNRSQEHRIYVLGQGVIRCQYPRRSRLGLIEAFQHYDD